MSGEDAVAEPQVHESTEQVAVEVKESTKEMEVDAVEGHATENGGDDYVVVTKEDVKDMPVEEEVVEKPKPAKSPAKKRPASDDEDDEEPDPKKTLFGAEPIVEGRRQRKEINHYQPEMYVTEDLLALWKISEKKPMEIPAGKGTKLRDILHIQDQLSRITAKEVDSLKKVHKLLFKKEGTKHNVRSNIREFSGFVFATPDERTKRKEALAKHTNDELKFFCDFFNVSKGAKEEMVDTIMEFLDEPQPTKNDKAGGPKAKIGGGPKAKASKKSGKSSGKSSGKASKKSKKGSDKGPKRATTAFMFFSNDRRAEIMKENPEFKITDVARKLGELWKGMSEEDKQPYEKKAAADKRRYEEEKESGVTHSTPKKKASAKVAKAKTTPKKKPTPKKVAKGSSDESESDSEDDAPIAKKKGPSDGEIKKTIADIVKKVGDEVTFNKVKEGLLNKYPSLDVSARKAEFKEWAREIIESQ